MSKIDPELFQARAHALEKSYEICPECGGELQHRNSKSGPFLGCSQYPICSYSRSLQPQKHEFSKLLEGTECPDCKAELMLKQGRYGMYVACSRYPECQHMESAAPKEEHQNVDCPNCKAGHLIKKQSRYGKTFYACSCYPKCKYIINQAPVQQSCPECAWKILVKKKTANGERLVCPQKGCNYQQAPSES